MWTSNYINVASASLFLLPLYVGIAYIPGTHEWNLGIVNGVLTATSYAFHSQRSNYMFWLMDQVVLYVNTTYGMYLFFSKTYSLLFVSYFLDTTIFKILYILNGYAMCYLLFFGGKSKGRYCFCTRYGNVYHALLHFFASTGTAMIILL